ncbi:MAG: hypothetical protein NC483_03245 [Ruminococcus sp.]|nr:hypothetical protein [Ruminococcus sp.]
MIYLKTRMEKYYDEQTNDTPLRQHKNENLYENISNYELEEDYRPDNNATIIDDNAKNINVEQIKRILDTKYNKEPKRRSIMLEEDDTEEVNVTLDNTREYDINAILEQARTEKEDNYEQERVKKIRDTQFDILNSLELKPDEDIVNNPNEFNLDKEIEKENKQDNEELLNLINTITMHEIDVKKTDNEDSEEINPLDILTDLKGSDDTVIINGIHEEESINETSPIMSLDEAEKKANKAKEEQERLNSLTNTLTFTQSDFDDFNDLKKEVKSSKALIYVAIILVSLVLIVGLVIFLNKFLNLSLF